MQNSYIYLIVICFSSLIAFSSQKIAWNLKGEKIYDLKKTLFFISCLIAWFPLAFTKVGVDYNNYLYIAHIVNWNNFNNFYSLESGFNLILVIMKAIFGSEHGALFGVKTLTILLMGISIYLQREKVKIGYSFTAYMLLVYLPSFFLLSSCLACSILLLAISIWRSGKKKWLSILLVFVASTVHDSVKLIIPLLLITLVYIYSKMYISIWKIVTVLGAILAVISSSYIYKFVAENSSSFHYGRYNVPNSSGTGLMVYIVYLPIILYCLYVSRLDNDFELKSFIFVFSIGVFTFRLLSYKFVVIERVEYLLMSLYIIFIPEEINQALNCRKLSLKKCGFILILIIKGVMVYTEFINDKTGLLLYTMFNPFE